ncbi:MAG: hypothetical protein WBB29_00585 [Geitlerinemataceae cyanobacterium]
MNEDKTIPYDAQKLAEEIDEGERKSTKVNTEEDYEKAQKYATANPSAENTPSPQDLKAPGNPEQFRDMAQEVNTPEDS